MPKPTATRVPENLPSAGLPNQLSAHPQAPAVTPGWIDCPRQLRRTSETKSETML